MDKEYQQAQVSEFIKPEQGIPGYKPTTEVTREEWDAYQAQQRLESQQIIIAVGIGLFVLMCLINAWREGRLEQYLNLKRPERRICFAAFLAGTVLTIVLFLIYRNPLSSQAVWISAGITGLALIGWLTWEIIIERFLNWIKVGK